MVTSYFIMKMSKRNNTELDDYYSSNFITTYHKSDKMKCRICLRNGNIPIQGNEDTPSLAQALLTFADVYICEDDEYPKHLCRVCYKFIKDAILFRKTAKLTEEILKKPVKLETEKKNRLSLELEHDYEETAYDTQTSAPMKWDNKCFANLKPVPKQKLSPKVTCKICNKLVCRAYYKAHLTMHDPNHEKKHVCEICGKKFRLNCSYYNHRKVHQSDFPYKCKFCPYRGRYGHLLRIHLRTHSGDYKYMCNECPKRFLFKSNMNAHILKKHHMPQHKCNFCKRMFHSVTQMQKHYEADHLGIKNHICNVCGKAFGYRNAMMKHQRGVHKRKKMSSGRMPSYLQLEDQRDYENVQSAAQLVASEINTSSNNYASSV